MSRSSTRVSGLQVDEAGNAPHTLRLAYQRHLLAYEEDCSKDAAAAHPAENGSGSSRKSSKGKGTKRPLPQDDATQAAQILEAMLGSSGGMGLLKLAPEVADRASSGDAASQLKLRRKRRAKVLLTPRSGFSFRQTSVLECSAPQVLQRHQTECRC